MEEGNRGEQLSSENRVVGKEDSMTHSSKQTHSIIRNSIQ
jgi:hypothetical protein